jgi:2-polyprenyl-6-methoxyphenol hydroxylase-like FAD-dependent oxidoreductase
MAGRTVRTVADEFDGVRVEVDDGETLECDFVVACDGYRSTLRGICFPDAPLRYSGYVIWRGWFDERAGLLDGVELIAGRMNTFGFRRGHGNLWVIPGAGSAERGYRQVAWNLYDPLDGATFQETLRERDGSIRSVPPGGCTPEQLRYLNELAERALPRMVADAIAATPAPLMSPIFDLRLRRLTKGRVALLGDAGMVLRPVTGSGATKGLQDALALGEACGSAEEIDGALARYDAQRRPVAQALVELGVTMGEALVTEAPDWPKMSPLDMTTWHQRMMAGRSWYALDDGARLQGSSPSR